jgi:hypothetical protein
MSTISTAGHRAGVISFQISRADAAAWGQALEATTHVIAAAAVAAFVAGEALGRWVHETSAVLGQLHACLLAGRQKVVAVTEAMTSQVVEQLDLAGLTVRELRARALALGIKKAGGRRVCSATKTQLLAALA